LSNELITFEKRGVLLTPESSEGLRDLAQPFKGVDVGAPSGLEPKQRVGGAPLRSLALVLRGAPDRGRLVFLPLPGRTQLVDCPYSKPPDSPCN
jgi:hypothetical protein